MARRRRRGGRRGFRVGKYINLGFKVIAAAVAIGPSVRGIKVMATGDFENGGKNILFDYTGINAINGSFDGQKALGGLGSVLGAVLIAKLGSWLGRRF